MIPRVKNRPTVVCPSCKDSACTGEKLCPERAETRASAAEEGSWSDDKMQSIMIHSGCLHTYDSCPSTA
jgi:hypothetical protein